MQYLIKCTWLPSEASESLRHRREKLPSALYQGSALVLPHQPEQVLLLFAKSEMWLNQWWLRSGFCCKVWPQESLQESGGEIRGVAACCISWKLKVEAEQNSLTLVNVSSGERSEWRWLLTMFWNIFMNGILNQINQINVIKNNPSIKAYFFASIA